MTDLREELRLIGCHANGDARCTCVVGQDALALIDSQAAEIERLRSQVQSAALDYLALDGQASEALARATAAEADAAAARRSLRTALVERDQTFKAMHDRVTAAEAERDALRDALMKIADMTSAATWAPATGDRWLDRIDETARAALGRQP